MKTLYKLQKLEEYGNGGENQDVEGWYGKWRMTGNVMEMTAYDREKLPRCNHREVMADCKGFTIMYW